MLKKQSKKHYKELSLKKGIVIYIPPEEKVPYAVYFDPSNDFPSIKEALDEIYFFMHEHKYAPFIEEDDYPRTPEYLYDFLRSCVDHADNGQLWIVPSSY